MKKASEITNRRKKELGYEPIKKGQVRVYQLTKMKSRTVPVEDDSGDIQIREEFICPKNFQVSSKYVIQDYPNETNKNLQATEIIHQVRTRFNEKGEQVPVLGEIYFTREDRGFIRCNHNMVDLDAHLFFSPYNERNANKEGYSRPRDGYTFKLLDTDKEAEDIFEHELKVGRAVSIIGEWDENTLKQIASGLSASREITLGSGASTGEIKKELARLARKRPDRILNLDEDVSVKVYALYREAVEKNILESDGVQIFWSETRTPICTIPSGISPEEAFKAHVLDHNHKDVLKRVEDSCEQTVPA